MRPSVANSDSFVRFCVYLLVVSGFTLVPLFVVGEREWEDPVSFRKAILFGISTGVTLWSCDRVFRSLQPWAFDSLQRYVLATSLVVEVLLITVQTWRGERSHFNSVGNLNATIETAMLVLISIATVQILVLTVRGFLTNAWLETTDVQSARKLALQGGMFFLSLSCLVGVVITLVGKHQLSLGLPPELFGQRGALKFPHGVVLHAIQVLELASWIGSRYSAKFAKRLVKVVIVLHVLFLLYAIGQTSRGKGRWEIAMVLVPNHIRQ